MIIFILKYAKNIPKLLASKFTYFKILIKFGFNLKIFLSIKKL